MIGRWLRFGEGEPPQEGEAIVCIRHCVPPIELVLYRRSMVDVVVGVYRGGILHEQSGTSASVPHGCWWTSLPHPSAT